MTTSSVSVDSPNRPAPLAGAGGAGPRQSKARAGASQDGFSALLDSIAAPSAPQGAAHGDTEPSRPSSAIASGWPRLEPETDEAGHDRASEPADPLAGLTQVAVLPPIPLPVVGELTATPQPSSDSNGGIPAAGVATTAGTEGHLVASTVPMSDVVGLVLPPETMSGEEAPAEATMAPALPATDSALPLEYLDANARLHPGSRASMAPAQAGVKTADVEAALQLALERAQAPDTKVVAATEPVHRGSDVEAPALELGSSRAERARDDGPTRLPAAIDPGPVHTAAVAGSETQTSHEWSGQDAFARTPGRAQSSRPSGTGSSEHGASGFVVPSAVADRSFTADGLEASAQAADASRLPGANETGLESQLVQTMRTLWRGGVSEARVTLRPEYLGAVTISLRLESGGVQAHLRVEDPQVAAWVQANESLLKTALAGQGLTLERLVVSEESKPRDERGQPNDRERQEPRRQRRGAADGTGFTLDL